MDRLNERLESARKARSSPEQLAFLPAPTAIERDAAIQRFEYTFEASWKAAQRYLLEVEKIASASPKAVIRSSRDLGVLSDADAMAALQMSDDRNLTSHTYNEGLAAEIFGRLRDHAPLLRRWLDGVSSRVTQGG